MKAHFFLHPGLQNSYKTLMFSLCALMVLGCTMTSGQDVLKISGVYRLDPTEGKAHASDSDGVDKFRVYTKDYYICASINTIDSVTSFEIGTYKIDGNKMKEHIINGSRGSTRIDPADLVSEVQKNKQGIQIIRDSGTPHGSRQSTVENYNLLEEGSTSILDGAWNQLDSYSVAGNDTTSMRSNYNFKISYNGYFIWGAFHKFPNNPQHETHWGVGTFEMKGDSILDKRDIMGTLPWIKEGKAARLYIEFINDDTFKQTIHDNYNKIRYIEIYQRLESSRDI